MKCFYHPQSDAVSLCKNCIRGLCLECAVDVGNGIACKGRCETQVISANELIERNKKAYQKQTGVNTRSAILYGCLGLVFMIFGLTQLNTSLAYFLIPVGIIFLLASWFTYSAGKKFAKD